MEIEKHIRAILEEIDPNRADAAELADTPGRVARSYREFFSGYGVDLSKIADVFYESESDDLIVLKNIPFESHCEHHMVPIVGTVTVGYVPDGKILGVSKLARIVDCFARRLQLQERMTAEIGRALEAVLKPKGTGVYAEAEHFCVSHRGVRKHGAKFVTRYFSGVLTGDLRREFLSTAAANG
jgi:GTP cyclohydrolase I